MNVAFALQHNLRLKVVSMKPESLYSRVPCEVNASEEFGRLVVSDEEGKVFYENHGWELIPRKSYNRTQ